MSIKIKLGDALRWEGTPLQNDGLQLAFVFLFKQAYLNRRMPYNESNDMPRIVDEHLQNYANRHKLATISTNESNERHGLAMANSDDSPNRTSTKA